jgi:hypothetical protein
MEPSNAAFNSKVFGVMLAQLFRCKLLQAISILRLKHKLGNYIHQALQSFTGKNISDLHSS